MKEPGLLERDGYAICREVIDEKSVSRLREAIGRVVREEEVKPYGIRSIADRCPAVGELAESPEVEAVVTRAIDAPFRMVRSILFDKVPGANWHVGWHQDLSIAVRERPEEELSGFTGWTEKEGVTHVQAPTEVLDRMITLRVSLDDADEANGALRVIPESHAEGRLDSEAIRMWIDRETAIPCTVRAGDVIAMRPQILHASHRARSEGLSHRRVIHLEYAPVDLLPDRLKWQRDGR